jgi:hypothetical protein
MLANLGGEPLDPQGRLLAAQRLLNDVLEGEPARVAGRFQTPGEYLYDLRCLCLMLLLGGEREDLGELPAVASEAFGRHTCLREQSKEELDGRYLDWRLRHRRAPTSAALMAAILPTATESLAAPSMADLSEALSPLAAKVRERLAIENLCRLLPFSSRLAEALEPELAPARAQDRDHESNETIDLFGVFEASLLLAVERSRFARWLDENEKGKQSIAPPVAQLRSGPIWMRSQIEAKLLERYEQRTHRRDEEGMRRWAREHSLVAARRWGIDPSEVDRLLGPEQR